MNRPYKGKSEYQEAGMLIEHFTNLGISKGREQGIEQGRAQGARATKLEDARKMREHGIDWRIVTDVTGITPEELQEDK
jgi:predicted transposase/invertase (TIGR01784 family)